MTLSDSAHRINSIITGLQTVLDDIEALIDGPRPLAPESDSCASGLTYALSYAEERLMRACDTAHRVREYVQSADSEATLKQMAAVSALY